MLRWKRGRAMRAKGEPAPERLAYEKAYRARPEVKSKQAGYIKSWYVNNKERARENARRYREANREKVRAQGRAKARRRKGVKNATAEARSGPCPICTKTGPLVLDHDHATGLTRGWICRACNCAIGHLGDTPLGLRRAIAYLLKGRNDGQM